LREAIWISAIEQLTKMIDDQWNGLRITFAENWTIPWVVPAGERNDFEIYLLEKGTGMFKIGNKVYPVKPDNVLFLYSMSGNSFIPADGSAFRFIFVTFKFTDRISPETMSNLGKAFEQEEFPWNIGDNPEVAQLFYQLHEEIYLKTAGYQFRTKIQLSLLIDRIVKSLDQERRNNETKLAVNPGTRDIVDKVILFMQKNYRDHISLTDLAKKVNVHPRYLCAIFKQITGHTITEYLTEMKIEKAKRMLLYTSLPITDIALDTGFNSSQYFSRIFNRFEGTQPRNYRKCRGGL
jgi:AraC-like DNA-binding protein